jgi:hypothetical protein
MVESSSASLCSLSLVSIHGLKITVVHKLLCYYALQVESSSPTSFAMRVQADDIQLYKSHIHLAR